MGEVERRRDNGHARAYSNVVEATAPGWNAPSCTLRRDSKHEAVTPIEFHDRLLHDVVRRASLHWNAADSAKYWPEGPAEDRVLAEPGRVDVDREVDKEPNDEVPVGCVRRDDDDELGEIRQRTRNAPAKQAEA